MMVHLQTHGRRELSREVLTFREPEDEEQQCSAEAEPAAAHYNNQKILAGSYKQLSNIIANDLVKVDHMGCIN